MRTRTRAVIVSALLASGLVVNGGMAATAAPASASDHARACATPAAGHASCGAIQLLDPSQNWHPGHRVGPAGKPGGGSGSVSPPSSGYYPGDLQSAYGLGAVGATSPGPSAPTIAIVDAYDDPYAASNLAAYRSAMSGATSPTGLAGSAIPPLCGNGITSGCVTFTKVNQSGGTSYPRGNTSWAEEISLDLDMASAVCPNCNIVLVEASSASFSNLEPAVNYAKSHYSPAVITNSYGGSEFSGETSYNSVYSSTTNTAVTVSSGDNGYGVEFPAASPGVTAVGGTSLTYQGSGHWTQSVWSGAGAGCSAYETQPSWQGTYSLSADCTKRQVADISAVADPNTGVAVYDSYGQSGWMVFGGTSASAQIIGAMYALAAFNGTSVNTSSGALYTSPSGSLVPVTSGSDGSCGNYLCNAADSVSGYNGPAGLGTPFELGAFTGSATAPPPATPTISLSASPTSATVTAGGSTSYTLTVTASGGFGGTVDLSQTGCPTNECTLASTVDVSPDGSATTPLTVSNTSSDSGSYSIQVTASDPTGSAASTSTPVTLNVNPVTSSSSTMNVAVTSSVSKKGPNWHVPITVTATDATSGVDLSGAGVTLGIYPSTNCTGSAQSTATGTTGSNGSVTFNFSTRQSGSWCALATVTDTNYTTGTGQTLFNT